MTTATKIRSVAILAFLIGPAASADGIPLFVPVPEESVVNFREKDWLSEAIVLRYRFVEVSTARIWEIMVGALKQDDLSTIPPLTIDLFNDVTFDLRLVTSHAYRQRMSSTVTVQGPGGSSGHGIIFLTRDGNLDMSLRVDARQYHVIAAENLPYHAVVQLDPDLLPDID